MFSAIMLIAQFILCLVMCAFFFSQMREREGSRGALAKESVKKLAKMNEMRKIKLTEPMSETARPQSLNEIIGQSDALRALRAALCTPNPQHILIYGPPGVGKTAAARAAFFEAKKSSDTPFLHDAKFIEVDATTLRFDERSIADPLIGSVHDPIYQGAGSYGAAGVPQPKEGAVTKAHGGVLFIDEIGELHGVQMNKLLKVLEDRRVMLESSYYSSENRDIPSFIHDIFQNGLPADFRLIGATTRSPHEIPPALRSRCVEIFFSPLTRADIFAIAKNAANRCGTLCEDGVIDAIADYAVSGRDAVKLLQSAAGCAISEKRKAVTTDDILWVARSSKLARRRQLPQMSGAGRIFALGIAGSSGTVLELEASVRRGSGKILASGIAEREEVKTPNGAIHRKSSAFSSLETVISVIEKTLDVRASDYDIRLNFIGGMPIDGPSAGAAMFLALYAAFTKKAIPHAVAASGEVTLSGDIRAVGGIAEKTAAARDFGISRIFIPFENEGEADAACVKNVNRLIDAVFSERKTKILQKEPLPLAKENVS